jgi:hypothetical protein
MLVFVALVVGSLGSTGCAHLANRGRDALDIFDVGILVSDHVRPDFAAFMTFWNLFPMGYAHVDGKLIGIGGGRAGIQDFQHVNSWGMLVWGAEQHAVGDLAADAGAPQRHDQGWLRLALGAEHKPPPHTYYDCDRTFVLGWIGLHLRIKLDDLADFVTGWAGMDIMHDDDRRAAGGG